jgi:hypothetical protein
MLFWIVFVAEWTVWLVCLFHYPQITIVAFLLLLIYKKLINA